MITPALFYEALSANGPVAPPHCFRMGEAGDILLADDARRVDFATRIRIANPREAGHIVSLAAAQDSSGIDLFASCGRGGYARFHILSPGPQEEAREAAHCLLNIAAELAAIRANS